VQDALHNYAQVNAEYMVYISVARGSFPTGVNHELRGAGLIHGLLPLVPDLEAGKPACHKYPSQKIASSAELSIVLAAQRSGSARAASSGPTTLPKPWQADKYLYPTAGLQDYDTNLIRNDSPRSR
jgi:hypothetical protein